MEIQIAYSMMDSKTSEDSMLHPLDTHYMKLNCAIDVSYKFSLKLIQKKYQICVNNKY